ncbi:40S ribosomal protein S5-1 [Hordeum vulgare]|nr:40S ribosomal protein S5-1 [Hordeum vulgare]
MLHIRDVEGPKKTGSVETRLEAMEQQVFKCQGMVERGLNANHMMITEFTSKHKMDAIDIGKHLSRLYDRVDLLQGQIYDLQNQNFGHVLDFKFDRAAMLFVMVFESAGDRMDCCMEGGNSIPTALTVLMGTSSSFGGSGGENNFDGSPGAHVKKEEDSN